MAEWLSGEERAALKRAVARGERWEISGTELDRLLTSDVLDSLECWALQIRIEHALLQTIISGRLDVVGIGADGSPLVTPNEQTEAIHHADTD